MITTKELLTTYWSQFTLLLLSVGYLIRRLLDIQAKKNEINHNLFQQKRLESVNTFFTNCSRIEHLWKSSLVWDIMDNKINVTEIDNVISPILNEMKRNVLELQIYFSETEHVKFAKVSENLHLINGNLMTLYFSSISVSDKSKKFLSFREERLLENTEYFKEIANMLKKTFK